MLSDFLASSIRLLRQMMSDFFGKCCQTVRLPRQTVSNFFIKCCQTSLVSFIRLVTLSLPKKCDTTLARSVTLLWQILADGIRPFWKVLSDFGRWNQTSLADMLLLCCNLSNRRFPTSDQHVWLYAVLVFILRWPCVVDRVSKTSYWRTKLFQTGQCTALPDADCPHGTPNHLSNRASAVGGEQRSATGSPEELCQLHLWQQDLWC